MRSERAHRGAPSGTGHQRAARAVDVDGFSAGETAAAAASKRRPTARERRRWGTVGAKTKRLARMRRPCGSLRRAYGGGNVLAKKANTRAYGPDASDPVRLVAQIAAVLSIGAGVIHVSAAGDHTDLPVMFGGFMVVATLQVALGVVLLRRPPSR